MYNRILSFISLLPWTSIVHVPSAFPTVIKLGLACGREGGGRCSSSRLATRIGRGVPSSGGWDMRARVGKISGREVGDDVGAGCRGDWWVFWVGFFCCWGWKRCCGAGCSG